MHVLSKNLHGGVLQKWLVQKTDRMNAYSKYFRSIPILYMLFFWSYTQGSQMYIMSILC